MLYNFSGGVFTKSNLLPIVGDGEDWIDWLRSLGYVQGPVEFGVEDGLRCEVYMGGVSSQAVTPEHEFVVLVDLGGSCYTTFVSTFPDLVDLLSKIAPILSLGLQTQFHIDYWRHITAHREKADPDYCMYCRQKS